MATRVQFRRGTTAEHSTFTGAEGEITVNTTKDTLVVHDGSTAGGFEIVSLAATQTLTNKTLTSPTLTAPVLGTPSSGTLTNCTGLPVSTGVSGLGTGVATALAVNTGSAGAFVTFNGALGTPSSGTLTNATGLPISSGVTGLGTGVATFLATPSSANLISAITDETGSGALVFGTSPAITTSITTPSTSFALVNTTATTVNFAGAATTVSIGASTGTTTVNNSLVVTGDLTINGTTNTINSTTITVDDKNLELGSVASPTNVTADGGGITLKGTTDKTFNWVNATAAWTSSEDLNLLTGKVYEINGTTVLSATALGSGVTGSSLTSVGTIATGVWQGTLVSSTYGGTGVNNGGRTITLNTGNLTITAQAAGSSLTAPSTGTIATLAGTETLTNKTIAAASNTISGLTNSNLSGTAGITNANLANSTISGISLGSNLAALTIGTGLSGTSYNGSAGVTIAIDSTVTTLTGTQTLTNKTLTTPALNGAVVNNNNAVSAAGTTQGTATALTVDYNVVTTVAAGAGVVLPTATAGRRIVIVNKGANVLTIYPATSAYIDALAVNAGIQVAANGSIELMASSTTQWYSISRVAIYDASGNLLN